MKLVFKVSFRHYSLYLFSMSNFLKMCAFVILKFQDDRIILSKFSLIYILLKDIIDRWWWPWLPRWHSGQEFDCQCRRHRFNPWVRKIPWSRKWQPTSVFLPGKSHGWRSLVGCNSWGHNELDLTEHAHTKLKGLTDRVLFFIKRVMGASKAGTQTMLDLNGKP